MDWNLFGFQIKRAEDKRNTETTKITKEVADGSIDVESYHTSSATFNQNVYDFEFELFNDAAWIHKYREIADLPDVESAISDVCQEAIVIEEHNNTVEIDLDETEFSKNIQEKIREEFDTILNLLDFDYKGYDLFKDFYVDGRLYAHMVVDNKKLKEGLIEVNFLDPIKTKKIKEHVYEKINGVDRIVQTEQYFMHDPNNDIGNKNFGHNKEILKLTADSVSYIHSGIIDRKTNRVKSYLHKAVKSANQLAMLEDSLVIYRLARASEKRVFYVDVGNLPGTKADQYIKSIITKFKNKLVFDSATGEIKDNKNHLAITEDIFLPRRNGSKGTEISTLDGARALSDIEDILYFRKKLYKALNIPLSRLENESNFNIGRSSEITRDELKFNKFVNRVKNRFSELILTLLKVQLKLKNIISENDWKLEKNNIYINFNTDSFFTELKNTEILQLRLEVLAEASQYTDKYFSVDYISKNILKLSDDEIKQIKADRVKEKTEFGTDNDDI